MAEENVVVAVDIFEMDLDKIMLSPLMTKTWSFKHKETGEQCKGSYNYVLPYYEKPKQTFCPMIKDVRTNTGIQKPAKFKSLFLSVSLNEEQSKRAREIDDKFSQLLFDARKDILKGYAQLSKVTKPSDVAFLMRPLVQDGQPKSDGSEDKYDDQITMTVPWKTVDKQLTVDTDACTIEDINGKPYSWAGITGNLSELAFAVTMIKYDEQLKFVTEARVIVPTEASRAKVTTKRKLEQAKETKTATVGAKKQATGDAKSSAKPKPMQSRTKAEPKPAVSAFNSKLNKPLDETDAVEQPELEEPTQPESP